MKQKLKSMLPSSAWLLFRQIKRSSTKGFRRLMEAAGYNIARTKDYYSPLPTESVLVKNAARWNKPSALAGVNYDLDGLKRSLKRLVDKYGQEFNALPSYSENRALGFGPGYTQLDAMLLYMMVRELRPRRYLEVGSGLSTYYCSQAAAANANENQPLQITCIEPYPFEKLYSIPGIQIIKDEVQNVPAEKFLELEAGDVLFIDSSHVVRLDGDVPYLFLEILPIIKPGVVIHVHDIPFPYNIPYPAEHWILGTAENARYWPVYWNEAMLLQAFLAFNREFEVIQATPLLRHFDERVLRDLVPFYRSVEEQPDTFSSIWLRRNEAEK